MDDAIGFVEGLSEHLSELPDPRVAGRCDHLLMDIISIAILAVFCGADEWTEIEAFGKHRVRWLKSFLPLPNGIPSHDTFRRVFGRLDRQQFAACLFGWMRALHEATAGQVVAIDGKSLRRSGRTSCGLKPLHLVTAWATQNGLVLGQVPCAEKSNEITAIPELLRLLNLKGATVTIDAMGCQKEIAAQIRDQTGHYLLGLKGNQPTLEADMQELFDAALVSNFDGVSTFATTEAGHGRTEQRIVQAIRIPQDHPQRACWRDLNTLVAVTTGRTTGEDEHWETRFYISSHASRARQLGQAVREHWSIENSQHHVLDVTFDEDHRRQSDRNGAANLAAIRRLVLSVLRQEKTHTRGAKCKRFTCALDPEYLNTVLASLQTTQI
jgi:predicted transposase YbfD/YdcC